MVLKGDLLLETSVRETCEPDIFTVIRQKLEVNILNILLFKAILYIRA